MNIPTKFGCLPLTPPIVTQPDDRSDAVSLGSPEARGRFLVTHDAILGVGSIYIVFYQLNMYN